jgi:hypothetical protein
MTRGPLVGSRRRCTREDLYEQCSLHITLKTPSSVYVGRRPSSSMTRENSSAESLCWRARAASTRGSSGKCAERWAELGRDGGDGFEGMTARS